MNKPHKHAEVIKAWADGATIQIKSSDEKWYVTTWPMWDPDYEYRVKPDDKSYLQIYCETCHQKTQYPNGWGQQVLERLQTGIDAVVKEVCERNNIPYPCK